ncbi:MAG: hypothetical protein IPK50_21050 [Fibrobacterota bacterium]|nr:MAG: hypothetical protein IPK50_21050 [Fibrobacterota bacterium]
MKPISCRTISSVLLVASLALPAIAAEGDPYTWPAYSPSLNYNYKERMGTFPMPTKDLDDKCAGVVGTQSSDWWTFKWGKNKRSVVTEKAITPLLARLNKDFAYFRDSMGWAPDSRIRAGGRSAVYLYGSGMCTDGEDSTALGGWQSAVGGHPIILASYYPIYSFDPSCTYNDRVSQQGAMVHEGIHSLLASLPGAKQAAWFQEGGNTWLQQEAETRRNVGKAPGPMGFLNGAAVIAPFIPIECYSGWLLDGSFGGPSAEGVNVYGSDGKQLCNWRNLLGGYQYGNMFPTFLGEWMGVGTVPWIWNYAKGRVLQGMADTLGDAQTRRFIQEYRARMALMDLKKWSNEARRLANDNFGSTIKTENTPAVAQVEAWTASMYTKTTDSSGVLVPEARTLPGWSGANYIPLKVTGSTVKVGFKPIGQNMSLQLCYRGADGVPVYGVPVASGSAVLRLDKAPVNGVVIAVVANTDYKYLGDATRKAKFDYRLVPEAGVTAAAETNKKWYDVKLDYASVSRLGKPESTKPRASMGLNLSSDREAIVVGYDLAKDANVKVSLYTAYGALIAHVVRGSRAAGNHSETIQLEKWGIERGTFLVTLDASGSKETRSITVLR